MRAFLSLILVAVLGASPALAQAHARSHYSRAHNRKIVHNRQYPQHGRGKGAPQAPKPHAPKPHAPKHHAKH